MTRFASLKSDDLEELPTLRTSLRTAIREKWYHLSDITWASWCLKSRSTQLFVQQFVEANNNLQTYALRGICEGNPLVTDGFPAQRSSNAESVSTSQWRHNEGDGVSNYQSSPSLAFVRSLHKGPAMWKIFLFEYVIMHVLTSSWYDGPGSRETIMAAWLCSVWRRSPERTRNVGSQLKPRVQIYISYYV